MVSDAILTRPPSGMASRALIAMFRNAFSNWFLVSRNKHGLLGDVNDDFDAAVDGPFHDAHRLFDDGIQVDFLKLDGGLSAQT